MTSYTLATHEQRAKRQEYLEDNTILVVLCSEKFDSEEYIHDIDEILNI